MSDYTDTAEGAETGAAANAKKEEFKIVNAYDDIVRTNVRELMKHMNMCQCEKCFLDACAIVFNRGFARFVTSREGELLSKIPDMNHSNHIELVVAITGALNLVKNFPKH
jgi:competence protein ComFB